jgi:hypothetical protein
MAGDKKIGIRMKKARLDAGLLVIKLWLGRSVDSDISIRLFRRRTLTIGNTRWSYLNDAINPTVSGDEATSAERQAAHSTDPQLKIPRPRYRRPPLLQ